MRLRIGTTKDKPITEAVQRIRVNTCGVGGAINNHLTKIEIYDLTTAYRMFREWLKHLPNSDDSYFMDTLFQIAMELSWVTGPTLGTDQLVNDDIIVNIFADELRSVNHKDVMSVNNVDEDYLAVEILRTINKVISYTWPTKDVMVVTIPLLWIWSSTRVTIHIGVINDTCLTDES